ncbi:MAG: hypothetical protein J5629_03935 [Muribaculaceae bacterium]|nr:hypothetical protein [Muribaculaceae bacterium]
MIELFLDNKPAVLRENVSIKLTRENVYFTKSGSYTYDVELPLQCAENRAIFGSINRKDVETQFQEFHAVLRVDNKVLLDGKAVINQVTDTSVKVQLLGGNSEMNFYAKGSEVYIDELDLGDWQNEMTSWILPTEKGTAMFRAYIDWVETTQILYSNAPESQNETVAENAYNWWKRRWWSYDPTQGYDAYENRGVAFPVINSNSEWNSYCESGLLCNEVVMRKHGNNYYPEYRLTWPNQETPGGDFPQVCPSFQPMLCRTLRKIMRATGYPMDDDLDSLRLLYQSNNIFPRIFIACANNRREIAKALPHWTVNDFLTQIEHFMGIVIEVDETTHTSRIISRNQWWDDSNPTIINEVVDEYSVEVDKSETTDISNGNVGWADMEDGMAHISDDIMEVATIDDTTFTTLAQMKQYIINGASASDKNKIFVVDGHQFILYYIEDSHEYVFKEVNQLRPLKRKPDTSNIDVELKIVPAQLVEQKVLFVETTKSGNKWYDTTVGEGSVNIIIVQDRENVGSDLINGATNDNTDLQALIEGEETVEKGSSIDKMYVAMVPDGLYSVTAKRYGTNTTIFGPYPRIYAYPRYLVNNVGAGNSDVDQNGYISLADLGNIQTIANQCLDDGRVIDTTVKYCIKFISNEVLRSTGLFIINNKKYACEKLEYSITAKGVSPLVTGYFYRID